MSYTNDILVCTSGDVHGLDTKPIIDKIKELSPKYFILWQVGEFHAPQFMKHVETDIETYGYSNDILELENLLVEKNTKFYLVLGGDESSVCYKNWHNYKIRNFKVLFWSTFLLHYSYYILKNRYGNVEDYNLNKDFHKLYINYNNKSRKHRCFMIDALCKNNLLEYGFNSWLGKYRELEDYEFECWKEKIIQVDNFFYTDIPFNYNNNMFNPKVFFNLITESVSHNDSFFITEKTYRTILFGQPFLVLSSKGFHKLLTKYGFLLYDEIFDYSFDEESDLEKRIEGIIKNIHNLKDKNYHDLNLKIEHKIIYNRNMALSIIKNDSYFPNEILEFYKIYGDSFLRLFDNWNETYRNTYPFTKDINLFDEILKTKL